MIALLTGVLIGAALFAVVNAVGTPLMLAVFLFLAVCIWGYVYLTAPDEPVL